MKVPIRSIGVIFVLLLAASWITWRTGDFYFKNKSASVAPKNLSVLAQFQTLPSQKKSSNTRHPRVPLDSELRELSAQELHDFPGATVVEAAAVEGPEPGQTTELRILKREDDGSFIRTETIVDADNTIVGMPIEMIADRALVTLPEEENAALFLKKMGPQVKGISRVTADAPLYCLKLSSASLSALPLALEKIAQVTTSVGEPDVVMHVSPPSDPVAIHSYQWASWNRYLINIPTAWQLKMLNIGIQEAWNIRTDASSVIVAVIDTGVCYTHADLAANMWHNPFPSCNDYYGIHCFPDLSSDLNGLTIAQDGDTMDVDGHGTHCAGIIGALGNNKIGVHGVAWKVQLMACRAADNTGVGSTSTSIAAIDYACDHGASILNCSWGSRWSSNRGSYPPALLQAFERARRAGVLAVCAAGNGDDAGAGINLDSNEKVYPASYSLDNIISVAALSLKNELASFSNYGATTVHLAAPGSFILSTWSDFIDGNVIGNKEDSYAFMSGTSCAVPFVVGALALLKAEYPKDSYLELRARLLNSVDPNPALQGKTITGGTLNIGRALAPSTATIYPSS